MPILRRTSLSEEPSGVDGRRPALPTGEQPEPSEPPVAFGPHDFERLESWHRVQLTADSEPHWWQIIKRIKRGSMARREARTLGVLVLAKAKRLLWETRDHSRNGRDDPPPEDSQVSGLADWVVFRFQEPLAVSGKRGKREWWWLLGLSLLTAGFSVAASLLAVVGSNDAASAAANAAAKAGSADVNVDVATAAWLAAGCGIAASILTATAYVRRPGQRSAANFQLAHILRDEGWDFVSGRGDYRGKDGATALELFIDKVGRLQRDAEKLDETVDSPAPTSSTPTVGQG
jgi:hypothetical protein